MTTSNTHPTSGTSQPHPALILAACLDAVLTEVRRLTDALLTGPDAPPLTADELAAAEADVAALAAEFPDAPSAPGDGPSDAAPTPADDALRHAITTALLTTPAPAFTYTPGQEKWDHHSTGPGVPGHRYSVTCALCRGDVDTLADAVLTAVAAHRPAPDSTPPTDGDDAPPETADTCHAVDIGGETIHVRSASEPTEQERALLGEVVAAARRRYAAEHPEQVADAPATGDDMPVTDTRTGHTKTLGHITLTADLAEEAERFRAAREKPGSVLPVGEVTDYATDRGTRAWAWRCWGDSTCDGALGLDHDTERSAQRGLERHQADCHPGSGPARRALLDLTNRAASALSRAQGPALRGHVQRLLADRDRLAAELEGARRDAEAGWKHAGTLEQDVTEWAAAYSALIRRVNDIAAQLDAAEPGAVVRADELVPLLRAGQPAKPPSAWVGDPAAPASAWARAAVKWEQRAREAEAERDGAYRERAHLLPWLATLADTAVITDATDTDEPGWSLLYLTAGGRQLSWHIAPRDRELFDHVEHVPGDDPRARWDGHSTAEKYQHILSLHRAQDA
jgi:hypothetical protein